MITINYNGKTYKITRYDGIITQLEEWIMSGGLEEVKENKDFPFILSPESCGCVEKDTSILEKLREELEKRIEGAKQHDISDYYYLGIKHLAEDLLTSLETKEEPDPEEIFAEDMRKQLNSSQPQFTPGQEIECSHTGKEWDWFKEKFTKMVGVNKDLYGVEGEESWYRFARPIEDKIDHDQVKENIRVMDEQDGVKIEPELPEYKAPVSIIYPNAGMEDIAMELTKGLMQLEALTTFCQALARQKTNK